MLKVLFVCVSNSARSQMAEAFMNKLGNGDFKAESAGIEPGKLNPLVVRVMNDIGYDISKNSTNSVFSYWKEGRKYSIIINLCDQSTNQKCPVFPMTLKTMDWNITDPALVIGNEQEKLEKISLIRDEIKTKVETFISQYKEYAQSRK